MSLALHGHHILIIATLAFAAAVLIPAWYTAPDLSKKRNIFDICTTNPYPYTCYWILLPTADNYLIRTLLPVLVASFAIACAGTSLIGLILGSWYIQRFAGDIGSKWLLILTIVSVSLSFLLSCAIWSIMLTTNLHQQDTSIRTVRLQDFGFSFWINIGASAGYLYALLIYVIAVFKNS